MTERYCLAVCTVDLSNLPVRFLQPFAASILLRQTFLLDTPWESQSERLLVMSCSTRLSNKQISPVIYVSIQLQETEDLREPIRDAASKVVSTGRKPVRVAADWISTLKNAIKTTKPRIPTKGKVRPPWIARHGQRRHSS